MQKNNYPNDWSRLKIKEMTQRFLNGGTPSTHVKEYWDGNIPWITGADAEQRLTTTSRKSITELGVKRSSTNIVPKGNILLVTRTGVGKVSMSGVDVAISQDLTGIIPRVDLVDVPYLYYQLIRNISDLKSLAQGSIIQGIKREEVENIEIPLPELTEQRAIADILSTLDEAIAQSESLVRKYQSIKQGLMSDLLTRGVDENGEPQKLSDITHIIMGQSPPGNTYNQDGKGLPLINGPVEFGERYPKAIYQWTSLPLKKCQPGDILLCVRGSTTGRINIAQDVYCIGRGVAAIREKEGKAVNGFVELLLMQISEKILSEARGSGSTFPSITSGRLSSTLVTVPDVSEQAQIVEIIESSSSMISAEQKELEKLKLLKQGLMQDLLSGQVRVKV